MTESQIQKAIIDELKKRGFLVFRMNSGMAAHNIHLCPKGTPDLLAVSPRGVSTWIEVKTKTGKVNKDQAIMHYNLKKRGCSVIVARDLVEIQSLLV